MLRRACAFAAVVLLVGHALEARADDTAIAESMFQQGVAAMERGDYAHACSLLAGSQRLDPGGGTLLNLALCHERGGKIATAWAGYHDALGVARRDGREDRIAFAAEHIKSLEPRLPMLSIALTEPLPTARAKIDGVELPASAWETVSPVDPGEHVLRVEAPGRAPWSTTIVAVETQTRHVTVPRLAPSPTADSTPASTGTTHGRTQRILAWSFTSLGGAAVITSAVLGALAIGAESIAQSACPRAGACADARGLDASNRASTLATAATVTGISGLVALAGGIVLFLTATVR